MKKAVRVRMSDDVVCQIPEEYMQWQTTELSGVFKLEVSPWLTAGFLQQISRNFEKSMRVRVQWFRKLPHQF